MTSLSLLGFTYGTRFIKTAPAIFLNVGVYINMNEFRILLINLYCDIHNKHKLIPNSLNVIYNHTTVRYGTNIIVSF